MLRPSKGSTSIQVLSQFAALHGGILKPISYSRSRWAGALINKYADHRITIQIVVNTFQRIIYSKLIIKIRPTNIFEFVYQVTVKFRFCLEI